MSSFLTMKSVKGYNQHFIKEYLKDLWLVLIYRQIWCITYRLVCRPDSISVEPLIAWQCHCAKLFRRHISGCTYSSRYSYPINLSLFWFTIHLNTDILLYFLSSSLVRYSEFTFKILYFIILYLLSPSLVR